MVLVVGDNRTGGWRTFVMVKGDNRPGRTWKRVTIVLVAEGVTVLGEGANRTGGGGCSSYR